MITSEQVRTVIDRTVCDSDGNKIGSAKHVFLDDVTGSPEWVSVKTGLFGTKETFVPIRDAAMVDDHLEVPYAKDTVKNAPNVDVDAGGHLSESEEHRLYQHYGIDWDAAWQQANQPGDLRGGIRGTAGAATEPGDLRGGVRGTAGAGTEPGDLRGGMAGEDVGNRSEAMTRSEERMHVGTERREAGHARLRKYVVTEEQEQTVPVRHEEVRVEREPITEADRKAGAGTQISEAEQEVTLHEERPVTQIETVPVERVRLTTEEVTEQETVRGQVRKEQIETETDRDIDRRDR